MESGDRTIITNISQSPAKEKKKELQNSTLNPLLSPKGAERAPNHFEEPIAYRQKSATRPTLFVPIYHAKESPPICIGFPSHGDEIGVKCFSEETSEIVFNILAQTLPHIFVVVLIPNQNMKVEDATVEIYRNGFLEVEIDVIFSRAEISYEDSVDPCFSPVKFYGTNKNEEFSLRRDQILIPVMKMISGQKFLSHFTVTYFLGNPTHYVSQPADYSDQNMDSDDEE